VAHTPAAAAAASSAAANLPAGLQITAVNGAGGEAERKDKQK